MQAKLAAPPPHCYCKIFAQLNFQLKIFGSGCAPGGWPRLRLTLTVSCLLAAAAICICSLATTSDQRPELSSAGVMAAISNKLQKLRDSRLTFLKSNHDCLSDMITRFDTTRNNSSISALLQPLVQISSSPLPPTSLVHKYHSKHKFEHKRHKMFAKSALGCGEYNLLDKYEFANFLP